ncbi:MAG: hypothetical protein HYU52_14175 [Acidobacteria bacterium]|nr:hypothetical protein [Acidobacteriota bacterium]
MSRKELKPRPSRALMLAGIVGSVVVAAAAFVGLVIMPHVEHSAAHAGRQPGSPGLTSVGEIAFDDVERQSKELIGYYNTIQLTAEQEAIKLRALEGRPAACCKNSNAYTCCCKCNLSKTVWGLANYAIAERHASESGVNALVDAWLAAVNPSGYEGETCYQGGCALPGNQKGCGGMTEEHLVL